ncbi:MarR family transcriptional regulator [Occultella glacieicola]|uniref:MarR family transcriptional regulator n=1 Tax=Occultella glacieicola TaxID=2518684 RepID=A0ABY2E5F8_9MICO|nr:MarR family transcriptional regulator [Occultella glacieicola]TDE95804.1 MarR family transcriptional regulator [Occultella glacieicola]
MSTNLGPDLLAAVALLNRWATARAEFDVPAAQARLLALVERTGPARISDLARADRCSQPTMTAQVQRVEELGWVTRTADPTDGRAALVELSEQGRVALREVRRARERALEPSLAELSESERAALEAGVAVMRRLVELPAVTPAHAPTDPA